MSSTRLLFLNANELCSASSDWDDLWARADPVAPSNQAAATLLWWNTFAADRACVAVAVEQQGRLVAAIPLAPHHLRRLPLCMRQSGNGWSPQGDLLLDLSCDCSDALQTLIAGLRRLPRPLLWLDMVQSESARWQAFLSALQRLQVPYELSQHVRAGRVEVNHDWSDYRSRWSRNHRRHMRVVQERADKEGGVLLRVVQSPTGAQLQQLLQRGFAVEDLSWKAGAGSSVLRSPGMFEFYAQQAAGFASQGNLSLTFLEHRGQAIAFEYGWSSHGVYYTPKVGYDPAFSHWSPGQLLRLLRLERAFGDADEHAVDFLGILSDATSKWATHTYPIGRIVMPAHGVIAASLFKAYRELRRRRSSAVDASLSITPGAAPKSTATAQMVEAV